MRAAAEREVLVRRASDVEAIRIGEPGRVAVGGREHAPHLRVLAQHDAAELDVGVQDARGQDDRPVEAQALLDRARDQLGLRAQPRELGRDGRMSCAHAVADEPDGGLEAGDEEADRLRQQLERVEPVAGFLGADQRAQEVVGQMVAALGDQLLEVAGERHGRRGRLAR